MTKRERKIEQTLRFMLEKAEEEDWYEKGTGYPYECSKKEYEKILETMDSINKQSKDIKIRIENPITMTVWIYRKP